MAAKRLSPHPSNPLEVESSDFARTHHLDVYSDSDDPLADFTQMDTRAYQSHIADIRPDCAAATPRPDVRYVDLDEGMSSEESDDLQALGQDDTPRKAGGEVDCRQLLHEQRMGDEDEVMEEDKGDVKHIFDDEEVEVDDAPTRPDATVELVDEDEEMADDWEGDDEDAEGILDDGLEEDYSVHHYSSDHSDGPDNDIHPTSSDADCFALDESLELSTLRSKPLDEQSEIQAEIADFHTSLPQLSSDYKLIDRLGTGTFSSVYKAIDLRYHEYDNSPWLGRHPQESSAHYQSLPKKKSAKVFVAIKRIYVTSGPERIKNELQLMENCRGCRHVSQLITAFRHDDQVAIVMPYHRNEDFRVRRSPTSLSLPLH